MNKLTFLDNFQKIDTNMYSVLGDYTGAAYDNKAMMYEKLVSKNLYNKIIWGTSPNDYKEFAQKAIGSTQGLLLDAGCGGLIQTSDIYLKAKNTCVLVDNSAEMLKIAKRRLGNFSSNQSNNIHLVQADVFDLPFPNNTFDSVCSFGMIHLFDNKQAFVNEVLRTLKPGGAFYFSTMTTKRAISSFYMSQLRKMNEFGELYSENQTSALFDDVSLSFKTYMKGSMLFIEGRKEI
jgi:ubiquinone/menaquinone biosynthesis C-methylase UbiE